MPRRSPDKVRSCVEGKLGEDKKKIVIGLTGSFGSGKSTVAGIFASLGAQVIDADRIARASINPAGGIYRKIVSSFGGGILKENGAVDRKKLAEIVFKDKDALKKLNSIIHPSVIRNIKNQIKKSNSGIVVLDAPLLFEAGLRRLVDKIVVVKIGREKQIRRLQKKTSLGRIDILKRIRAQMPLRQKIRMADFIIDNNVTKGATRKQVKEIFKKIGFFPK